jgi:hypothetical protein
MTSEAATLPDATAQLRWDEWKARGAEVDRRTAKRMRILILVVGAALASWFAVQLA